MKIRHDYKSSSTVPLLITELMWRILERDLFDFVPNLQISRHIINIKRENVYKIYRLNGIQLSIGNFL